MSKYDNKLINNKRYLIIGTFWKSITKKKKMKMKMKRLKDI